MFYCDPCAQKLGWPDSIGKSQGPCEICGKTAICSNRPSSSLPRPKCQTCFGTGNCPCGATDCGPKRCPDCYCDWCSEAGMEIVAKDDGGKNVCAGCADWYAGKCQ